MTAGRSGTVRYLAAGSAVIALLLLGLILWAASVEIGGAVIAQGLVVVASSVKKVQHPVGGVVAEILVRNGDRVKAGDLLVRLEDRTLSATFDMLTRQVDEAVIKGARLKAERDGFAQLELPRELVERSSEPHVAELLAGEGHLLESRRSVVEGQRAELRKRIQQLREEAEGVARQIRAKEEQIELLREEIETRRKLDQSEREGMQLEIRQEGVRQLEASGQLLGLRREAARLDGELGRLKAEAAQIKGRIAEIELQNLRLGHETRSNILMEFASVQAKAAELSDRRLVVEDQLRHLQLRAPAAGRVHELSVASAGAVIAPGEVALLIVPDEEQLVVEAHVEPRDIDQVLVAKEARVRFPAFDPRVTPEVRARLTQISADLARDRGERGSYFVARVEFGPEDMLVLGRNRLVPGMPAEVFIATEAATPLSFLLRPLSDQIARAWK